MCSHSPLDIEMCKPNKSLRLTIKAFIKSEEKKRAAAVEVTPVVEPTPALPEPSAHPANDEQSQPNGGTNSSVQAANDEIHRQLPKTDYQPEPAVGGATDPLEQVEQVSFIWTVCNSTGQHADSFKVSTEQAQNPLMEDANQQIEHVNQTPGIDEDGVMETTEGEEQEVTFQGLDEGRRGSAFSKSGDQNGDQTENQTGDQSSEFDGSTQNMDWNNANGFNPMMMNMPNMQNAWGGFPNMMG